MKCLLVTTMTMALAGLSEVGADHGSNPPLTQELVACIPPPFHRCFVLVNEGDLEQTELGVFATEATGLFAPKTDASLEIDALRLVREEIKLHGVEGLACGMFIEPRDQSGLREPFRLCWIIRTREGTRELEDLVAATLHPVGDALGAQLQAQGLGAAFRGPSLAKSRFNPDIVEVEWSYIGFCAGEARTIVVTENEEDLILTMRAHAENGVSRWSEAAASLPAGIQLGVLRLPPAEPTSSPDYSRVPSPVNPEGLFAAWVLKESPGTMHFIWRKPGNADLAFEELDSSILGTGLAIDNASDELIIGRWHFDPEHIDSGEYETLLPFLLFGTY